MNLILNNAQHSLSELLEGQVFYFILNTRSACCRDLSKAWLRELEFNQISQDQFQSKPLYFVEQEQHHTFLASENARLEISIQGLKLQTYAVQKTKIASEDFLCILHNITLQRKTELSFAKLFERYESILQATLHGYLLINTDGFVVNFNRSLASILDISEFDLFNKHITQLAQIDANSANEFIKEVSFTKSQTNELGIHTHSGDLRQIELSSHLISGTENDLIAIFVRDITEHFNTRQGLFKVLEKTRELAQFKANLLNNINHEFKSPLHRIQGLSKILQKEISDTASQVYLDEILTSADQLLHSLTTVMELARQQTEPSNKQVSAFRVEDIIRDLTLTFEETIREKELKLDSFVDSAIPDIICDRFLLEQTLKILTGNAVKFTPPHGKVLIKAQLQSAHQIEISIADTGIGMNPDFLGNIFEPFVQEQHALNRPFQGLGLGLSLAKRYIEMLDAEISISSEKNVGTTAYIRLPINSN